MYLGPSDIAKIVYCGPCIAAYFMLFDGFDESCVMLSCIGFVAFPGNLLFASSAV